MVNIYYCDVSHLAGLVGVPAQCKGSIFSTRTRMLYMHHVNVTQAQSAGAV